MKPCMNLMPLWHVLVQLLLNVFLWKVPFLLLYSVPWPSYFIAKILMQIPYLGIVNILADKFVHKEFIQKKS